MLKLIKNIKEKFAHPSTLLFSSSILFLYLLVFGNAFSLNSNVVAIFIFLVSSLLVILFKREYRLMFIFNLLLISTVVKASFFPTSLVTIIILLFALWELYYFFEPFIFKKRGNARGLVYPFILMSLLILYIILLWIVVKDNRPTFNRIISYAITILFVFTTTSYIKRHDLVKEKLFTTKMMLNFIVNLVVIAIFSLPVFVKGLGTNFYNFTGARDYPRFIIRNINNMFAVVRFSTTFHDPNVSGLILITALAFLFMYFKNFEKLLSRFKLIILGILLSLFAVLSFSKMVMVLLGLLLIVRVLQYVINSYKNKRPINILVIYVPLLSITISLLFFGDVFKILIGRFSEGFMVDFETTLNALTTYRFFIVKDIVSKLLLRFDYFIFGVGIENTSLYSVNHAPHDTVIQTLTNLGLIFTIVFILFITSIYKSLIVDLKIDNSSNRHVLKKFIYLGVPMLGLIYLSLLTYTILYLLILFVILALIDVKKEESNHA